MAKGNQYDPGNAAHRALAKVAREKAKGLSQSDKTKLVAALNRGDMAEVNRLIGPR